MDNIPTNPTIKVEMDKLPETLTPVGELARRRRVAEIYKEKNPVKYKAKNIDAWVKEAEDAVGTKEDSAEQRPARGRKKVVAGK